MREKGGGVLEGKPLALTFDESIVSSRTYKPENGECWLDVMARARTFLNNIIDLYLFSKGEDTKKESSKCPKVLAVTHGGFIKEFVNVYREIKGMGISEEIAKNTAIYIFYIESKNIDKQFTINMILENDNSHLNE